MVSWFVFYQFDRAEVCSCNRFGPRGGQGFADRFFTIDRPSVAKLLKHSQTKNNSPGEIIRVCVLVTPHTTTKKQRGVNIVLSTLYTSSSKKD